MLSSGAHGLLRVGSATIRLPPYRTFLASDHEIRDLLRRHRTYAIVARRFGDGDEALRVLRGLRRRGYRVLPVAAAASGVDGVPAAPGLCALREKVGVVVLADPGEAVPALAEAAAACAAEALWLQPGVADPAAAFEAHRRGLVVVLGRDIVREHDMFFPDEDVG